MEEPAHQGSKEQNPFGELLGLKFQTMEGGKSECLLKVENRLKNPNGVVHGGVIYSMADTAMGGALFSTLSKNETCATIEMNVKYFRAVFEGDLTCRAQLIHRGRRIGYLESEVFKNEELIAKASATFSILGT